MAAQLILQMVIIGRGVNVINSVSSMANKVESCRECFYYGGIKDGEGYCILREIHHSDQNVAASDKCPLLIMDSGGGNEYWLEI